MYLIPFVYSTQIRHSKIIHSIRILQEGDHVWQETDEAAARTALEENNLVPRTAPATVLLKGHPTLFVSIDATKTDLSQMFTAEELDAADTETHRWCTYWVVTNRVEDGEVWLSPPPDASVAPFSLEDLLRHILKACCVEQVNGGHSA